MRAAAVEGRAELVVMLMEVWDLLRILPRCLASACRFAAVCHAMPFLISPVSPGDFDDDARAVCASGITGYRRQYIEAHAAEAGPVLRSANVIANNRTVGFYLRHYFPDANVREMGPSAVVSLSDLPDIPREFDFAYMARMERGKGVEHLAAVLSLSSGIAGRKLRVAVLGRADDAPSEAALEGLLDASHGGSFEVRFFGWSDDDTKRYVLRSTSAFIYPSRYDNYPTVLNEALASGLPVVTWDTLFYRLNYAATPAVFAAPDDLSCFAQLAVWALADRERHQTAPNTFIGSLPGGEETADADVDIFLELIEGGA